MTTLGAIKSKVKILDISLAEKQNCYPAAQYKEFRQQDVTFSVLSGVMLNYWILKSCSTSKCQALQ